MKKIDFRFNSLLLGIVIMFFGAVICFDIDWAQKFSGLTGVLVFLGLLVLVFNVTDFIFLMYYKVKYRLWGWKKVDWTLIVDDRERADPTTVAEYLHRNFGISTAVVVEGLFLMFLYVLSSAERYKIESEFFEED
jgi:hypothetical protein